MGIQISVAQDDSEVIRYDHAAVPLYIRMGQLSRFSEYRVLSHWHDDLEWIRVISGQMLYYVNGVSILLKSGDCLLTNSRQMHFNRDDQRQECIYLCVLVRPSLLAGNQALYQKYILPFAEHPVTPFVHLSGEDSVTVQTRALLDQIWAYKEKAALGYELQAIACLTRLWVVFLQNDMLRCQDAAIPEDLLIQQEMVSYIYQHFPEPLTLEKIAAVGNVCRSRCCQLFRKYMRESPVAFLNHYRLRVSRHMLTSTEMSVTEIAFACGFHSSSYYGKLFARLYQCTPQKYRQAHRCSQEDEPHAT